MTTVTYPHIEFDETGRAVISGKRIRVTEIVLDRIAHHWGADEIQRQHPHLNLAEIHSAFAYYYDHREVVDRQIMEELAEVDRLQSDTQNPALQARLRAQRTSS